MRDKLAFASVGHDAKLELSLRQALVFAQRRSTWIESTQRGDARCLDSQLSAEKFEDTSRDYVGGIHQESTHAQEAYLECQTQLQRFGVSTSSRRYFGRRECEELLDFSIA